MNMCCSKQLPRSLLVGLRHGAGDGEQGEEGREEGRVTIENQSRSNHTCSVCIDEWIDEWMDG